MYDKIHYNKKKKKKKKKQKKNTLTNISKNLEMKNQAIEWDTSTECENYFKKEILSNV